MDEDSSLASKRDRCDNERLRVIKSKLFNIKLHQIRFSSLDAITYKFQLKNKEFIKIWPTIRTSLNSKGRSIKYQDHRQTE